VTAWPVELDEFACWLWKAHTDRDGYGVSWRGRIATRAHVAVYRELVGQVPEGKALDHLCRNRRCVAPHHLEPVDQAENEKRKSWRYRAKRTHCPRGHELALHGVVTPSGGRVCRQCNREAQGERT
jgi:hypothetical protein